MHHSEFLFDFYLRTDFECFLCLPSAADDDEPNVNTFHVPSGFFVFRVTDYELYRTNPVVYSGDDVMGKFFSHIFAEAKAISRIYSRNMPMVELTTSEEAEYDSMTISANYKRSFTDDNQKTHHNNHVTGKYLFPACSSCNLALKPCKCKITTTQSNLKKVVGCNDDDDDGDGNRDGDGDGDGNGDGNGDGDGDDDDGDGNDEWTYLLSIVFHNLSSYHGHFVLQFFRKEYTKYTTTTGTKAYIDVGIIPLNGERNMLLKIRNIVLVDSSQFIATSLDNLVKALRKSGVDKFANTIRYFGGDDDPYFEKGCYPYEYDRRDEAERDRAAAQVGLLQSAHRQ